MSRSILHCLAAFCLLAACGIHAQAQVGKPAVLKDVTIVQRLGNQVPGDITFHDEHGKPVTLAQLRSGRPIVLALVYFSCPSLCTVVLNNTLSTLKVMPLTLGKDYDVWTISFDPNETVALAATKHDQYVRAYNHTKGYAPADGNTAANWHFLTGDQADIHRLTEAVGFHYKWDPVSKQFYHPAGLTVLSPDLTVSRYFFGVNYDSTDLRLAVDQAANGKVGSFTDTILLYCYHYDPSTGKYSLAVLNLLAAGGAVTLLVLGGAIAYLFRVDRRRTRALMTRVQPATRGAYE